MSHLKFFTKPGIISPFLFNSFTINKSGLMFAVISCNNNFEFIRDLSMEEIEKSGFGPYYIDHTVGVWPQAAGGVPFNACEFQSKGDPITDLFEDLAAEQKARSTYDNILRVVRNIPEIADPIKFLRAREVVHFQRFGEALQSIQEELDAKNFYAFTPGFDNPCTASCNSNK